MYSFGFVFLILASRVCSFVSRCALSPYVVFLPVCRACSAWIILTQSCYLSRAWVFLTVSFLCHFDVFLDVLSLAVSPPARTPLNSCVFVVNKLLLSAGSASGVLPL